MTEMKLTWLEKLAENAVQRHSGRFRKCANEFGSMMWPTGNDAVDDASALSRIGITRGALKGVREIVPGTIDSLATLTGTGKPAKRYISDPMRRFMMRFGGNAVRSLLDSEYRRIDMKMLDRVGNPADRRMNLNEAYWDYDDFKNTVSGLSEGAAAGTEFLGSLPLMGKAITLPIKGLTTGYRFLNGLIRNARPAARAVQMAMPAAKAVSGAMPAARAVSAAYVPVISSSIATQKGLEDYNKRFLDHIKRRIGFNMLRDWMEGSYSPEQTAEIQQRARSMLGDKGQAELARSFGME